MHRHTNACTYLCTHACMHTCMYAHMPKHADVDTHVHIHTGDVHRPLCRSNIGASLFEGCNWLWVHQCTCVPTSFSVYLCTCLFEAHRLNCLPTNTRAHACLTQVKHIFMDSNRGGGHSILDSAMLKVQTGNASTLICVHASMHVNT